MACTGPNPICSGNTPAQAQSMIRPSTGRLKRLTASALASSNRAAPSLTWALLPAVTSPKRRSKAALSRARRSRLLSRRTPSSWS